MECLPGMDADVGGISSVWCRDSDPIVHPGLEGKEKCLTGAKIGHPLTPEGANFPSAKKFCEETGKK